MIKFTTLRNWLLLAVMFVAGNVAAQTVLLSEDFSKCTSSQPDSPQGEIGDKIDTYTLLPGWSVKKAYPGQGNMKFGTGDVSGSITLPALDLSDETATYTLKFRACAWKGDSTVVRVTVEGSNDTINVTGLTNAAAPYANNLKEFAVDLKGTAESRITIMGKQRKKARFFLDDVEVTKLAAGQEAEPAVSAPQALDFGVAPVGTSVTKAVDIAGSDLTADLAVAVVGNGFVCATTTISKEEAAKASIEVVFTPTAAGDYAGTMTISGGGLKENVVIPITGSSLELVGKGTREEPYTVDDVFKLENPGIQAYVKGYIVGYIDGGSISAANAKFSGGAEAKASNLMMADDPAETDWTKCISVQLPSGTDHRTKLNVQENKGNIGAELNICGKLESYCNTCGIRSPTGEFDLTGVNENPEPDPAPEHVVTVDFVQASQFVADVRYVLTSVVDSKYKVGVPLASNYGYMKVEEMTYADGVMKVNEDYVLTIKPVEGGYTIQDAQSRYLYMNGDYNTFNVGATLPEPITDAYVWTISFNADGTALITNVEKGKNIYFDTQYNNFASYAEAGENNVLPYLYIEKGATSVENVGVEVNNAPIEVYSLDGTMVGNSLDGLRRGIYIVKQGDKVKKVIK